MKELLTWITVLGLLVLTIGIWGIVFLFIGLTLFR